MVQKWEGNWPQRIYAQVEKLGYQSVMTFAESNPSCTWIDLAAKLDADIAPVQVIDIVCSDYCDKGEVERYARSALVRSLLWKIPKGWNQDDNFDVKKASAFTDWESWLPAEYKLNAQRVWHEFNNLVTIPNGWLPKTQDDEIIVEAFKKAGFSKKSAD
jgi:hypothetical protein